jgi:outer membrane protein assembly factor BamB
MMGTSAIRIGPPAAAGGMLFRSILAGNGYRVVMFRVRSVYGAVVLSAAIGVLAVVAVVLVARGSESSGTSAATVGAKSGVAAGRCENLILVSARSGRVVRRFARFTYNPFVAGTEVRDVYAAVSDAHTGWFVIEGVPGREGRLKRLRNDGSFDPRWQVRLPVASHALARTGRRLYVGSSLGVEAFDAETGMKVWRSPAFLPRRMRFARNVPVVALVATPSRVYVGGDFSRVGGEPRGLVAALDARTGELLPWRMPILSSPGTEAFVYALALSGPRLYVGGTFSRVGGKPRPGIAAVEADDGTLTSWSPTFRAWDGATSIAPADRSVLVGGTFSNGGAFDARTGEPRPWAATMANATTVTVAGSTAYIGGGLRSSLPKPSNNLAAINVTTGSLTAWRPKLERFVSVGELAVSGGKVLVSGGFCNTVGDPPE